MQPGTDEDPSTSFVDDTFQFTLDPHVGYHPMHNPSTIPYQGSGPSHSLPSQYFPVFPPPIVSVDGISTLAPGSEDIGPLGEPLFVNELSHLREPLHLDEPLSLGDSFHVREPSPPPLCPSGSNDPQPLEKPLEIKFWPYPHVRPKLWGLTSVQGAAPSTAPLRPSHIAPLRYNNKIRIHQKIFKDARVTLIRSMLSTCPFLTEQERKMAAHEALVLAASACDEEYGSQWSAENLTAFYKSFTAPPSAVIMSTCKKISCAVAEIGYTLCSPIWSEDPEL
ncbi:hypothetical protein F4604DRAFT_1679144 [Suillus subluteus]|nr:hypothetical protein F4604DRAFT_1679144 [Suillus subluteus]